jgi:hypothetical protein
MSQRDSEAGSAFSPVAAASSAASSGMVMSAFSTTCARRNDRCGSSVASAAAGPGFEASPRANGLHQVHNEGNRNLEMSGGGAPGMAVIDKPDNPLTQIKRIRPRHRESPPAGSESRTPPQWNPFDSI